MINTQKCRTIDVTLLVSVFNVGFLVYDAQRANIKGICPCFSAHDNEAVGHFMSHGEEARSQSKLWNQWFVRVVLIL